MKEKIYSQCLLINPWVASKYITALMDILLVTQEVHLLSLDNFSCCYALINVIPLTLNAFLFFPLASYSSLWTKSTWSLLCAPIMISLHVCFSTYHDVLIFTWSRYVSPINFDFLKCSFSFHGCSSQDRVRHQSHLRCFNRKY